MDFRDTKGSEADSVMGMSDILDAPAASASAIKAAAAAPEAPAKAKTLGSNAVAERRFDVVIDAARDALLTD